MGVIIGTDDGRIFMGGDDGCVYELIYQVPEPCVSICFSTTCSCFSSQSISPPKHPPHRPQSKSEMFGLAPKCRKINHTQSVLQYLVPSALAGLFGKRNSGPFFPPSERDSQVFSPDNFNPPLHPSLLNFTGSKPERILQLCYDHTRRVLYARTHSYVQA